MDLSWTTDHRDGLTLVACRLRNSGAIARRVRLDNELDGPVLPPRTHGVPQPGWDADGVTVRIEAGASAAIGYAVPAPTTDPPVRLARDAPARDDSAGATEVRGRTETDSSPDEPGAGDALRALGPYRPPREVVTAAEPAGSGSRPRMPDTVSDESSATTGLDPSAPLSNDSAAPSQYESPSGSRSTESPTASPADPAAVDAWLDAVERRVSRAERLDGADVPTATEAVAITGSLAAIRGLDDKVEDDAERLRTVAERAAGLARRANEVEIPIDPLRRLA